MTNRDFEAEFRTIMIHEAARDRYFRGTYEWLLLGKTALVGPWFLNDVDEAELHADVAEYYGLIPEEVKLAAEICEQSIMKEIEYGQA